MVAGPIGGTAALVTVALVAVVASSGTVILDPMALTDSPWLGLFVAACVLAFLVAVLVFLNRIWANSVYRELVTNSHKSHCDIDSFCGEKHPVKAFKVVLAHRLRLGKRVPSTETIPLECTASPHVQGLKVTRRVGFGTGDATPIADVLKSSGSKPPIVICTIRMGFGHHRLAYSAASWALSQGHTTVFHDLLNIEGEESELIKSTDELYSKFSRYASEIGGPVEKLWGSAMLSGDADALRIAALTAVHLKPLLAAFPKDTPIITTHQLCALTCSAAGFTKVVNLVVDNHPQWFLTVPRTLNLVQGPVNYQAFLRFGISPKELQWGGHWGPYDMVSNIDLDCERRIARAKEGFGSSSSIRPRRILIPVGGAGAQRKFIIGLVETLAPLVDAGKVQLLLNAGDHPHMKTAFQQVLQVTGLEYNTVTTIQGVYDFQKRLLTSTAAEPPAGVTLFCFDDYFPAVATTDILCRVSDVLSCKPSELAFYPIPKLHIRRVGDHEADSAQRASELGDGTVEARELEDALDYVELFLQGPELLVQMNESIMQNNRIDLYGGCKAAVRLVQEHQVPSVAE